MQATKDGISGSRAELVALLAFASQEEADRNKWGVHFRVEGTRCFARATNGVASFQLEGESDGQHADGEWMVSRKFIVDGNKELETKQVLCFHFSGASLHEASVKENDKELGRWQSASDVAIPQVSFPWEKHVAIPPERRKIMHAFATSAPYLKLVMLAAKAVGTETVHWYAPADAQGPLVFVVGDENKTSGIGAILPLPSKAGASENDDEDEEAA